MKTIYLKGGLGNQMFQYAYGRSLELSGKKILFNTSFFNGARPKIDTPRNFKLNNFNIQTKAEFVNRQSQIIDFINKFLKKLHLKNEGFGYWQSEKYFQNFRLEIQKEFELKNPLTKESLDWQEKIKKTNNSVSIHIRRGDYIQDQKTKNFHGGCNLEYYQKALAEVIQRSRNNNLELFIFSDDITWAKENLQFPYPINFVSDKQIPDYEEMYLMSQCINNIIANSTFSWWAAWLNQNPNKIVIGPKQWFNSKTSNEIDILPKTWIQI